MSPLPWCWSSQVRRAQLRQVKKSVRRLRLINGVRWCRFRVNGPQVTAVLSQLPSPAPTINWVHLHRYRRPKILLEHAIDGRERPGGPARSTAKLWLVKDQSRLDGLRQLPSSGPANLAVIIKQSETTTLLNIFTQAKATGRLLGEHGGGGRCFVEKRTHGPATRSCCRIPRAKCTPS